MAKYFDGFGKDVTDYVDALEKENQKLKDIVDKCKRECKPVVPRKLRKSVKSDSNCAKLDVEVVEFKDKCLKEVE